MLRQGIDDTVVPPLNQACGAEPSLVCERVFELTDGSTTAARFADWFIDRPLSIVLIIVVALVATRLATRWLTRIVRKVVTSNRDSVRRRLRVVGVERPDLLIAPEPEDADERARRATRRSARASSISSVIANTVKIAIWTIAIIMILGELGLDLGPMIAGAGVAGLALGFGAQSLVKDFLSGLFMLMEDQYGIGDVVDLGEAVGTVEEVALRTTIVRGIDGTVWHVPNGEIRRVGNKSQHWSTAVVDIDVAYDTDLQRARTVMKETAVTVCLDDEWDGLVLDEPEVLGVETLGADAVTIRLTAKTAPGAQWDLQRALREALKAAFDDAGIEIPFAQRTVWLRNRDA